MAQFQSTSVTGSLTVTGQVVAQTLNVQQVTSSIVYSSGSNIFGNSLGNTQQFTGSVSVTGSLTVTTTGTELQVTSTGVNLGNALTDSHIISGSLRVNPNGLFVSGSGAVGIGTTNPSTLLHISGSSSSIGRIVSTFALSSGFSDVVQILNPNQTGGGLSFNIGKAESTKNLGKIAYVHSSNGSDSNRLAFGFYDADNLLNLTAGGSVGIGVTSPSSWTKLQLNGTAGAQTEASQQLNVVAPTTTVGHGAGIRLSAASGAKEAVGIIGIVNEASGNAGAMTFHTYALGADIPERMRITSDGYVRLTTSSGGIQFNGDTAAANALDDYEEGSFTPTIIGSSTAGTATYSAQNGLYTKIGRAVSFNIYIDWSGGTGSGNLRLSGLPFTASSTGVYPSVAIGEISNIALSANTIATARVQISTNEIWFGQAVVGGGSNSSLAYDSAGYFTLSGTYYV
jgi:hypothetical protein